MHYASTPSSVPQYLPLDASQFGAASFDFNQFPISTSASNAALPGMVGNESISSDFWKDGLGLGFGVGGGLGEIGGGSQNGVGAFDFWDLGTPGAQGVQRQQQQQQQQQDYMMSQGGGGVYDWSNTTGQGGAVGENRRAAEVMADQLMSSGW